MLRSSATFDLFSLKQLHHHCTMKSSTLNSRTNKAFGEPSSSSSMHNMDDRMTALMIPTTINCFEVACSSSSSSSSFNRNLNCTSTKDIREEFKVPSILKIDGPATRELERSIRLSMKRRLTSENSTPPDTHNGGSTFAPQKKNKPSEVALSTNTGSASIPLLNDWNNVYNCLVATVPVDEAIQNEPFPIIEYIFDDSSSIVSSRS